MPSFNPVNKSARAPLKPTAIIAGVCIAVFLEFSCSPHSTSEPTTPIERTVYAIKAEPSLTERIVIANKLISVTCSTDMAVIDKGDITALTSLLKDRESEVVIRAATALGSIGPPASDAIPALQKALRKEKAEAPFMSKRTDRQEDKIIETAILTLQGKHAPLPCRSTAPTKN